MKGRLVLFALVGLFAVAGVALADNVIRGTQGPDSLVGTPADDTIYALGGNDTVAALDGNDETDPDPDWLPLIATPAFPGYPSAHATLSGAARAVLERAFGKRRLAITLTNPGLPGIVLNYTAWEQITDDIADARVYGGIHFRYDQEAGAHQGRQVGRYILRHYLRSALGDDDLDDDE